LDRDRFLGTRIEKESKKAPHFYRRKPRSKSIGREKKKQQSLGRVAKLTKNLMRGD